MVSRPATGDAPAPTATPGANPRAALTPYPIPPVLRGKKVENLGDGFILRAIERCLGRFADERVLSPRVAPDQQALARLEAARVVVLAGANQLHDRYTVWPGLTAATLRLVGRCRVPQAAAP